MPLSVGVSIPGVTVQVGAGTDSASTAPATPSTPATPAQSGTVTMATSKASWSIQTGETIYVNQRIGVGPSAWVPYKAIYVFADGNACLVRDPDCVAYTGPLLVAYNLRRAGETYADS